MATVSITTTGLPERLDEIFTLLESSDMSIVDDMHKLILESISSSKEIWITHNLVDYYFSTQSVRAQEILAEVREPHDKAVVEKIQEALRTTDNRLPAIQLLLYLVHQQPPWTHRLVDRPVLSTLLKCLKNEVDIPILMTGIMVLVMLLPVVPVTIETHLPEIFDIFSRSVGLLVRKPASAPEVFMLHLHVAVYALFLRLYGMFPCMFLSYLRAYYTKKENLHYYEEIISPMLERVRLHPNLITGSKDSETSKSRWKQMEPQDIVVSCAKLSLDPIEGSFEELHCPVLPRRQLPVETEMKPVQFKQSQPQGKPWQEKMEAMNQLLPMVVDPAILSFSPSLVIGLSTPPTSQRATPAASFYDVGSSHPHSAAGTVPASPQIVTPTPEALPREMPIAADDFEKSEPGYGTRSTPNPQRGSQRNTPSGLNRAQGGSAFISPYSLRAPPSSQSASADPSPMKLPTLAESGAMQSGDFVAARSLQFDSPDVKAESAPKHVEMRMERDGGVGGGGMERSLSAEVPSFSVESLPSVVRTLSSQDSDTLDQEVSQITEGEDRFDSSGSFSTSEYSGSYPPHQHKTAQSVIQFMKRVNRIRFNSLTYHAGDTLTFPTDRHPRPGRARSCPPLRREPLVYEPLTPSPNSSSSSNTTTAKQETVSESAMSVHGKLDASMLSSRSQDSFRNGGGSKHGTSPIRLCSCQCESNKVKEKERDIPPALHEFATYFQSLLSPIHVGVCRECHQFLVSGMNEGQQGGQPVLHAPAGATVASMENWKRWPGREISLFSTFSPSELLDHHLTQGSELHAKELAHIPLTSKASWTHFGGVPPADEINILRGQILLLQNQVMYERHKRTNHAMRNRRLLRRIAHVTALEEQVQSLTEQLRFRESEVQQRQVSVKLLQDENHKLQRVQESDEYERLINFSSTIKQNKDLLEGNIELKNLLLAQRTENDDLKKELQEVRAKLFETKKENEILKKHNVAVTKWKGQVLHLQKELLLMGEIQLRLQSQLQQQTNNSHQPASLRAQPLVQALKGEVKDLKRHRTESLLLLEAAQCRIVELEDIIKSKEVAINQLKTSVENAKSTHGAEMQAVEDKYRSKLSISQQLETQILKLAAENDSFHQKLKILQSQLSRRGSNRGDSVQPGGKTPAAAGSGLQSYGSDTVVEGTATLDSTNRQGSIVSEERRDSGRGSMSHHSSMLTQSTDVRNEGKSVDDKSLKNATTCKSLKQNVDLEQSTDVAQNADVEQNAVSERNANVLQNACMLGIADLKENADLKQHKGLSMNVDAKHNADVTENLDFPKASDLQPDSVSVLSEGGMVASTRAMLYTDSEDSQSQSSHSNFTTDSGVQG